MYDLTEEIAQIIYLYNGGLHPEEYETITGNKKRLWKTNKSWDSQPEIELCEHERDEFRTQARMVVEYLKKSGFL